MRGGSAAAGALLAAMLLGCAHAPSGLRARGLSPATTTEDALAAALQPRRIALVVGVDQYRAAAFPDLAHAAADAVAVGETLRAGDAGGFDRVVTLVGPDQTDRARVLRELRSLAVDLLPTDLFVLYFSGHGTLSPGPSGARHFLLPADANPADLPGTALDLAVLEDYFGDLPAQRKALIVDACFHGEGKSVLDPDLLGSLDELAVAPVARRGLDAGEALLFASSPGRPAFEDDALGHGVYTHFLLQALTWAQTAADRDEDGVITAWEAHDYARGRVIQHTHAAQVPEATIRVVGDSDLALAGAPVPRATKDRALVFHYGGADRWAGASLLIDGRSKGTFPGTLVVPPGEHHVELRASDGQLVASGYAELPSSGSLDLASLRLAMREPRALLALRAGLFGSDADRLRPYLGRLGVALEGQASWRLVRGPARGLYSSILLGGGPTLTVRGLPVARPAPRLGLWVAGEGGWGRRAGRLQVQGGLQIRATLVPPSRLAGPVHDLLAEETGLLFVSVGPVRVQRREGAITAAVGQQEEREQQRGREDLARSDHVHSVGTSRERRREPSWRTRHAPLVGSR